MFFLGIQNSRPVSSRLHYRGLLLRRAAPCLLISLLFLPAVLTSCTSPDPGPEGPAPEPQPEPTFVTKVSFKPAGDIGETEISCADIFLYGRDGTSPLERHVRIDNPDADVILETGAGEWRMVAILNSKLKFNTAALSKYDSMRLLEVKFEDEDPTRPVMSGEAVLTAGSPCVVQVKPMLSRVILTSVTNTLEDYVLMEDPQVWLTGIPVSARLLQDKDFRPSQTINEGSRVILPHDVGFYTAEFGTVLWCYPNDTPATTLGSSRPSMKLSCTIEGEVKTFDIPLPPIPRASTVSVSFILPD